MLRNKIPALSDSRPPKQPGLAFWSIVRHSFGREASFEDTASPLCAGGREKQRSTSIHGKNDKPTKRGPGKRHSPKPFGSSGTWDNDSTTAVPSSPSFSEQSTPGSIVPDQITADLIKPDPDTNGHETGHHVSEGQKVADPADIPRPRANGTKAGRQASQGQSVSGSAVQWLRPRGGPLITLGPECNKIKRGRCWQLLCEDQSISESIVRHVSQYIPGALSGVGGRESTFHVGLFLRGPIDKLRPTVVISCSGRRHAKRLRKYLGGEWVTAEYPWLVTEVSTKFPYKAVINHCSHGETESDDNDDETDLSRTSSRVLGTYESPLYVFVKEVPNDKITFPADIYLGHSSYSVRKATIGGLIQYGDDDSLYGITVAHTLNRTVSESYSVPEWSFGTDRGLNSTAEEEYIKVGEVVLAPGMNIFGGRKLISKLDWAVVKFSEAFQVERSSYTTPPMVSRDMFDFSQHTSTWHPAVRFTTTVGSAGGFLGPYPSYVRCPGDRCFMKTLPVTLDGDARTVMGDCGSWVVNADTSTLCGYVSHGAGDEPVTFIVPANDIFVEIQRLTGCQLSVSPYRSIELIPFEDLSITISDYENEEPSDEEQDEYQRADNESVRTIYPE